MKIERRVIGEKLELRKADGKATQLSGYAAVFGQEAVIAGLFREQIAPGAFTRALKEDDVRALFNHDPNRVLGRTTSGTLSLSADAHGLHYDVTPPASAGDVLESVARGDVTQSSFGFQVLKESWTQPETREALPLRTIQEAKLFDVSPVTYPAYEETTAEARSAATAARATLPAATGDDPMTPEEEACMAACQTCMDACAACIAACSPMLADEDCGASCRECVTTCASTMATCGRTIAACAGQEIYSYYTSSAAIATRRARLDLVKATL